MSGENALENDRGSQRISSSLSIAGPEALFFQPCLRLIGGQSLILIGHRKSDLGLECGPVEADLLGHGPLVSGHVEGKAEDDSMDIPLLDDGAERREVGLGRASHQNGQGVSRQAQSIAHGQSMPDTSIIDGKNALMDKASPKDLSWPEWRVSTSAANPGIFCGLSRCQGPAGTPGDLS